MYLQCIDTSKIKVWNTCIANIKQMKRGERKYGQVPQEFLGKRKVEIPFGYFIGGHCVCACVCAHMCVCMYMCICVCARMCMYMCVYVHVYMCVWQQIAYVTYTWHCRIFKVFAMLIKYNSEVKYLYCKLYLKRAVFSIAIKWFWVFYPNSGVLLKV